MNTTDSKTITYAGKKGLVSIIDKNIIVNTSFRLCYIIERRNTLFNNIVRSQNNKNIIHGICRYPEELEHAIGINSENINHKAYLLTAQRTVIPVTINSIDSFTNDPVISNVESVIEYLKDERYYPLYIVSA